MPQYILLLQEPPSPRGAFTPEEMQQIIQRYRAWRQKLAAAGKLERGHKLREEGGRIMRPNGGKVDVVDGPYAEAKEVVGGLFVLNAESYDEAVELSRDCPHLAFGTITVREIEPTPGG